MKMKELFDRGEFVVSAEVGPPKGIHVDELVEEAKTYLKDVHAVNVTDNQSSVMRLGSLAMCKVLKDAGMDPIFQLACRDRNRIALESLSLIHISNNRRSSWAVLIRLEISNIDRSNYSTEIYNSVLLCKQETGSV